LVIWSAVALTKGDRLYCLIERDYKLNILVSFRYTLH